MSEKTVEEALRLIKNAEEEIIRLDTQSETALQTLKEKYDISTIEEGDAYLEKCDKKATKLEKELATKKKELEEDFPWEQ